jgi:uncharacterized protein (DUF58 family)
MSAQPAPERELVFPLLERRAAVRLDVAGRASRRRGSGGEVTGSRPYRRGDAMRLVDWRASARLSTARARDEFVVRERFAEDVVRVLLVVDRSPSMALFPEGLPWLRKPDAVLNAGQMILASARAAHALVGYAECRGDGPWVRHPVRDPKMLRLLDRALAGGTYDAPSQALEATLRQLTRSPERVAPGSFVFLLSDFLSPPGPELVRTALGVGWDLVPVVIQDPVWERSFPDADGVTLPLVQPGARSGQLVRLRRGESRARREANEARARALDETFGRLGVDPVLLTSAGRLEIHGAFLGWARARAVAVRGAHAR